MRKRFFLFITFLSMMLSGATLQAQLFTFDDIAVWAGEGGKRAALVVEWNDPRETNAMVWGYQWDGTAYGIDLLIAVAKADPRFHPFMDATTSGYGSAIAGIGYDANGDGVFFIKKKSTGETIYPDENGVLPHPTPTYDYDDYEVGDPDDYWQAGWYQGYWSYWLSTDGTTWSYSSLGAPSRILTDGCWDGWNYAVNIVNPNGFKEMIPAPAAGYTAGTFLLSAAGGNHVLSMLDKKGKLAYDVYGAANPSLSLDVSTHSVSTFGSKVYFVSDNRLLITDALKLTQQASLSVTGGRSFVGVNTQKAYLGTANGIYLVNLGDSPSVGSLITGTGGETGKMLCSNGYVFAVQKNKGVVVIDAETNAVVKTISGNYLLLTQIADGTVWAGAGTLLTGIDPATLESTDSTLPANAALASDWSDWNSTLFFGDAGANTLYWVNAGYAAHPNSVFSYNTGQPASTASSLFSLPDETGLAFSKAAISMNYQLNQLTVSADKTTGAAVENRLYMVDASNGDLLNTFAPALNGGVTGISYPDKAPKISLAGSYTFALNAAPLVVPLNGQLTDPDNPAYNMTSVVSSGNTDLVTASVADNSLTITPQAGESGNTKLTFFATSNGTTVKKAIDVVVTRNLEGVSLDQKALTLKKGGADTLDVTFAPVNATNRQVTWKSSNTSVATVNATTGAISARNVGETVLVVTSAEGAFTDTCKLTVIDAPLSGLSLSKKTTTFYVGQKDTLQVNFLPADAYNKGVTWTQNPTGIVSTSWNSSTGKLILTGSKAGTTVLSGKSSDGGFVDTCIVSVVFNPATAFALNVDTVTLNVPDYVTVTGAFSPADASNKTLTWTSANTTVATVNTSGRITASGAGETWVFAQSVDNASLKDSVFVKTGVIPVTGLTFSETAKTVALPKKTYYVPTKTVTPANASNKTILWTSSNEEKATVNASGTVTLKDTGAVVITGTTQDGAFTAQCGLTIVDTIHVTGFVLREDVKEVWKKVGNTWFPYNTTTPSDATLQTYTLAFEDASVVSLSSPTSTYLKALALGDSKVCFSTNDGGFKDTMLVHVVANAASVTLGSKNKEMIAGDGCSLDATVLPANAYPFITWTSSDNTVATVDANGNVTALKAGIAKIVATSSDNTTLRDTCQVTVNNQLAGGIVLGDTVKTLLAGDSWIVSAEVLPANTTNKRLRWTSSDYAVLDVDANGLVKALRAGTATVTAYTKDGGAETSCVVTVDSLDYTRGVFFVNEDWFGHQNSSLNFLTNSGRWVYNAYSRENPGKELGATSQYGAIYGDKLYIVSKQAQDPGASVTGSRLAVCDARTLKSLKEFENIATDQSGQSVADGRTFLGVDEHKGYIGTSNGIYVYHAGTMETGAQIAGTGNASGDLYSDQTGTMLRVGGRVFAVHQKNGIVVINAETDAVETTVGAPKDGSNQRGYGSVVLSKDGNLWCSVTGDVSGSGATQDYLIKLDPWTLDTTRVALPAGYAVPNSWYAWTADGFCSSRQENKLYWKNNGEWFSSTKIYVYDIDGGKASVLYDLADYDDGGWGLYGAGFRVNPETNDIYASLFRHFGTPEYRTIKLNPATNAVTTYEMNDHYWFPAMPVFPDKHAPVVSAELTDVSLTKGTRIYLGDKVTDADNMDAAIVKTILPGYNDALLSATIENDSLTLTPYAAGQTALSLRFNSNGKVVTKELTIVVEPGTGLPGSRANHISVYPNPFTDYLMIEATREGTVELVDLAGKSLLRTTVGSGSNRIGTTSLPQGVYLLKYGSRTVKVVK